MQMEIVCGMWGDEVNQDTLSFNYYLINNTTDIILVLVARWIITRLLFAWTCVEKVDFFQMLLSSMEIFLE